MSIHVERLSTAHVDAALGLVSTRFAAFRREVPELSERCGSEAAVRKSLTHLADRGCGAAAMEGGSLVGFLGALAVGRYSGRESVLSPEWGSGVTPDATPEEARRIYEALYAEAAREWTAKGAETQLLCLLANDTTAFETFSWFGFGRVVCDGIRSLATVADGRAAYAVRRAGAEDASRLVELDLALLLHHTSSPIFLVTRTPRNTEEWAAKAVDPATAIWLAENDSGPIGYLIQGPVKDDACDLIVDSGTSSISGAYVEPEARGGGIATALVARAVEWAREQGYVRLAVDFETANVEGVRFWLRHFRPIVVSFARTVRANPDGTRS